MRVSGEYNLNSSKEEIINIFYEQIIKAKEKKMVVDYGSIRTEVIGKLNDEFGTLSAILGRLTTTVSDIIDQNYLEGVTAEGYINEFETIVSTTFTNINLNVQAITEQLESICANYELQDEEML